jgi:hypothetical protein
MNTTTYLVLGVVVLAGLVLLTGCAPRGALRPTLGHHGSPPPDIPKADAWYIESAPAQGAKPFSCSFVEFDERGDYLDFQQHRHAYLKIKQLADKEKEHLLVVMYVHGWKNNAQSGDAVEFNGFLQRLTTLPFVQEGNFRVHGVYLAWRGNAVAHALDRKSDFFTDTEQAFGGQPVVNVRYARKAPFGWLLWLPEHLSYWSRKNAAEDKVSGVSIIRTIFTCGHTAKRYSQNNATNRVFLLGHSFGALMLEQSFAPASLARLTDEWPWDDEERIKNAKANPLPLDLVVLVNSAAPSIYAKQLHGYMVAHREALAGSGVVGADGPLIISLTSKADWATGVVHTWGNALAPLYPSLWRKYDGNDFILATNDSAIKIPQSYYYRRTPGHNPLLVNHWIVPAVEQPRTEEAKADARQSFMQRNMDLRRTAEVTNRTFYTSPRKPGGQPSVWQITTAPPSEDEKWSTYKGHKPVALGPRAVRSGYWILRCPKEIIRGHDDIWSQQAMETYAALFREAEYLRGQPPAKKR